MSNPNAMLRPHTKLAATLAALALLPACNDDDGTDVSKFGPEREELVGAWESEDPSQPGTITFRDDGTYTRVRGSDAKPEEGPWALKGSRLTWADRRQETIAIVDGTLYLDAFVRKPGKQEGLSGTWAAYRSDVYGYTHEVWQISGSQFDFDVHSVRDGYESNYSGSGSIQSDGDHYNVSYEGQGGNSDYYGSDHGRLAVQQLGPNALKVGLVFTPEIGDTELALDAWHRVPE